MTPLNLELKVGRLVDDAQLFPTRHGRWKLTFRLHVARTERKPVSPATADFFAVVAHGGKRFVPLQPLLAKGTLVLVVGSGQSRDIVGGRVVVETVAEQIYLLREEGIADAP